MSAPLTSAIAKKSPKTCEQLAADAVIKHAIDQGQTQWILEAMRKSSVGKEALDLVFPKPVQAYYILMQTPESPEIDDTEGLLLASKAPWLQILLKKHGEVTHAMRGGLGGFKLHWNKNRKAVEWASQLICQLNKEEIREVVGSGLGLPVDFSHDNDGTEDGEGESEEQEINKWCETNSEQLENALDTKICELFDERALIQSELVSPETAHERCKISGYNVLCQFHIDMTNWY